MRGQLCTSSTAGKWFGFVTAIWVQAISGVNDSFSNYSGALKSTMALTQPELNNLAVAQDVGICCGLLAGVASIYFPTQQILLLIGSIEGFVGYGVQWLVVSQRIRPLPYWQMYIFVCMGGNSSCWLNTAILVTCLRNFQKNPGRVSGLHIGYVGHSTTIFMDLCTSLFSDSPTALLLMLAIIPGIVCFTAIPFLREFPSAAEAHKKKEDLETKFFFTFETIAFVLAVYLFVFDFTGIRGRVISLVYPIVLLILLAAPLTVPLWALYHNHTNSNLGGSECQIEDPLLEIEDPLPDPLPEIVSGQKPEMGEDHTVMEVLRSLNFWILFLSFLCGAGTGSVVKKHIKQIEPKFVSFGRFSRFVGRIGSRFVSKKAAKPRALSQILMAVGCILMVIAFPGSLYVGSTVIDICHGVHVPVTVATASKLFGLRYFGLFYNILMLSFPLSSFLFSYLFAGSLYDAQATRTPSGATTTLGAHCYRLVFVNMALACILGFCLDIELRNRTKNVYSTIDSYTISDDDTGGPVEVDEERLQVDQDYLRYNLRLFHGWLR